MREWYAKLTIEQRRAIRSKRDGPAGDAARERDRARAGRDKRTTVASRLATDPDYRLKQTARQKLRRAVKRGQVVKLPCRDCGTTKNVEGHHPDYAQPLVAVWLCIRCHGKQHRRF